MAPDLAPDLRRVASPIGRRPQDRLQKAQANAKERGPNQTTGGVQLGTISGRLGSAWGGGEGILRGTTGRWGEEDRWKVAGAMPGLKEEFDSVVLYHGLANVYPLLTHEELSTAKPFLLRPFRPLAKVVPRRRVPSPNPKLHPALSTPTPDLCARASEGKRRGELRTTLEDPVQTVEGPPASDAADFRMVETGSRYILGGRNRPKPSGGAPVSPDVPLRADETWRDGLQRVWCAEKTPKSLPISRCKNSRL